jgi:hypothetical protein
MKCRCPTCGLTAEYAERYANKWHHCKAGCARYPGTRMIVVPEGTGILEAQIEGDWRRALRQGRFVRWAAAGLGAVMALAPWALPLPGEARGLIAGAGVVVAVVAASAARQFYCHKPPGL